VKHESAFQPRLATSGPTSDEWDRLPWLLDAPGRARSRLPRTMLAAIILLLSLDAAGAYAAGRFGVSENRFVPMKQGQAFSTADSLAVAEQISAAERLSWSRPRANSAY